MSDTKFTVFMNSTLVDSLDAGFSPGDGFAAIDQIFRELPQLHPAAAPKRSGNAQAAGSRSIAVAITGTISDSVMSKSAPSCTSSNSGTTQISKIPTAKKSMSSLGGGLPRNTHRFKYTHRVDSNHGKGTGELRSCLPCRSAPRGIKDTLRTERL